MFWYLVYCPCRKVASLVDDEAGVSPVNPESPTPHRDMLEKLLSNRKLPEGDLNSVRQTIRRYEAWTQAMDRIEAKGDQKVEALVRLLNEYKNSVELELIWDSEADFLFRQRGQLKLASSVLEEFLPRLADPDIIPSLEGKTYTRGPKTTFSAAYFTTTLTEPSKGVGLKLQTKDQDFTVGKTAYLRSSFDAEFPPDKTKTDKVYLAFIAAECKTNLDKSMFQGIAVAAHDLKVAIPGSKYYVLCEWLDMTPVDTRPTDIDEVIILRGKRMSAEDRSGLASRETRSRKREWYANYLVEYPIKYSRVLRFVKHMRSLFDDSEPEGEDIVERGYF